MESTISLTTFNVGLLSIRFLGKTWVEPTPYIEERLSRLPEALLSTGADVIALQEIYEEPHRVHLSRALKEHYPHIKYHRAKSFARKENGLMFISKWPILSSKFFIYRNRPLDERIVMRKGALGVEIGWGEEGNRCWLWNTHTTAGGMMYHPESPKVDVMRDKQIRQLLDAARQCSEQTIILGDLNTGPGVSDGNYRKLLAGGYVDAYEQVHGADDENVTWAPENPLNADGPHRTSPPQRIDHVLLSKEMFQALEVEEARIVFTEAIVPVEQSKQTLSDHYGLYVRLRNRLK